MRTAIFFIFFLTLSPFLHALAFEVAVGELNIDLQQEEKNALRHFSQLLIKTNFVQESKIYQHFGSARKPSTRATLLRYNKQIYLLAPQSFVSLSNEQEFSIEDINGKLIKEKNLLLLGSVEGTSVFKVDNTQIGQNISWRGFLDLPSTGLLPLIPRELTLLNPEFLVRNYEHKKLKFSHMGTPVLSNQLIPTSILTYNNGQLSTASLSNIFTEIPKMSVRATSTATQSSLEADVREFTRGFEDKEVSLSREFLSQKIIYRFGSAAYLYTKNSHTLSNAIKGADVRTGSLYPLQKALMLVFSENFEKEAIQIRFRIIVSLAQDMRQNPSIVTLSVDRTIIPTSWILGRRHWQLDSLPLFIENRLIPYLSYDVAEQVLDMPIRPFSGLFFEYGSAFYPNDNFKLEQQMGYIGYHLNFSRYISMNFKVGYTGLVYQTAFTRPHGRESYSNLVQFLAAKVGFSFHYPIMAGSQVYIMPFFGVDMGAGYMIGKIGDDYDYFNELLLSRVPVTLLVGWQTGFEIGFNAGLPMAIAFTVGYDQDFFGEQKMKTGPPGSLSAQGTASQFYASIYYKIGLARLKTPL